MIRTPIHRTIAAPSGAFGSDEEARNTTSDDYIAKLVKYVPAEVVAPFVALAGLAATINSIALIVVFIIGLIATPLYFWAAQKDVKKEDQPKWFFYFLALIAFVIWAIGSSPDIRKVAGLTDTVGELILGIGAMVIPLVDGVLNRIIP